MATDPTMWRIVLLSLLVAFLGMSQACFAQNASPQFGLKESDAPTGSIIRREVVRNSRIALNRTYAELTPEEKAIVASYYEKIEPGDEPPFPLGGLQSVYGAVAKIQQRFLVTGTVMVIATVDSTGNVTQVKVSGSPGDGMARAVGAVVVLSKFKPAVCAGQPCKMDFPFSFVFKVE